MELFLIILSLVALCSSTPLKFEEKLNLRPIIGVVSQETDPKGSMANKSYIPASYVKYVEMGGARVVPIMINKPYSYYKEMFQSINGVLFPGGAVSITNSGYAKAGQIFYKLAIEANDKGDYFPMWGTCLGFQLLTALTTGQNLMSDFDAEDLMMPLHVLDGFKNSKLFVNLPDDISEYLQTENVTENYHHYGLSPETYNGNEELKTFYLPLTLNKDRKGKVFLSTMEAYKYPFYGTQWHPEKNVYQWSIKYALNHDDHAVKVTQYFADFFISEARKSQHHFPCLDCEIKALIDNYKPVFSGDADFLEMYYFDID